MNHQPENRHHQQGHHHHHTPHSHNPTGHQVPNQGHHQHPPLVGQQLPPIQPGYVNPAVGIGGQQLPPGYGSHQQQPPQQPLTPNLLQPNAGYPIQPGLQPQNPAIGGHQQLPQSPYPIQPVQQPQPQLPQYPGGPLSGIPGLPGSSYPNLGGPQAGLPFGGGFPGQGFLPGGAGNPGNPFIPTGGVNPALLGQISPALLNQYANQLRAQGGPPGGPPGSANPSLLAQLQQLANSARGGSNGQSSVGNNHNPNNNLPVLNGPSPGPPPLGGYTPVNPVSPPITPSRPSGYGDSGSGYGRGDGGYSPPHPRDPPPTTTPYSATPYPIIPLILRGAGRALGIPGLGGTDPPPTTTTSHDRYGNDRPSSNPYGNVRNAFRSRDPQPYEPNGIRDNNPGRNGLLGYGYQRPARPSGGRTSGVDYEEDDRGRSPYRDNYDRQRERQPPPPHSPFPRGRGEYERSSGSTVRTGPQGVTSGVDYRENDVNNDDAGDKLRGYTRGGIYDDRDDDRGTKFRNEVGEVYRQKAGGKRRIDNFDHDDGHTHHDHSRARGNPFLAGKKKR